MATKKAKAASKKTATKKPTSEATGDRWGALLAKAEATLAKDPVAALEVLLEVWRSCRWGRLAELIERVSERAESSAGRAAAMDAANWDAHFKTLARRDWHVLAATVADGSAKQVKVRFDNIRAKWGEDPRATTAVLRLLPKKIWTSTGASPVWTAAYALLKSIPDPRVIEITEKMRNVDERLAKVVAIIRKDWPSAAVPPAYESAIAALERAAGQEHVAEAKATPTRSPGKKDVLHPSLESLALSVGETSMVLGRVRYVEDMPNRPLLFMLDDNAVLRDPRGAKVHWAGALRGGTATANRDGSTVVTGLHVDRRVFLWIHDVARGEVDAWELPDVGLRREATVAVRNDDADDDDDDDDDDDSSNAMTLRAFELCFVDPHRLLLVAIDPEHRLVALVDLKARTVSTLAEEYRNVYAYDFSTTLAWPDGRAVVVYHMKASYNGPSLVRFFAPSANGSYALQNAFSVAGSWPDQDTTRPIGPTVIAAPKGQLAIMEFGPRVENTNRHESAAVRLYDPKSGEVLTSTPIHPYERPALDREGRLHAHASSDRHPYGWVSGKKATPKHPGKLRIRPNFERSPKAAPADPDARDYPVEIAAARDHDVVPLSTGGVLVVTKDKATLYDVTDGREELTIVAPSPTLDQLAVSPDGATIVGLLGPRAGIAEGGQVKLCKPLTSGRQGEDAYAITVTIDGAAVVGRELFYKGKAFPKGLSTIAPCLARHPLRSGIFVPTASTVEEVHIDVAKQRAGVARKYDAPGLARHLAVSSDGRHLVGALDGGRVVVWETTRGKRLHEVALGEPDIQSLAIRASGREVLAVAGGRLFGVALDTGQVTARTGDDLIAIAAHPSRPWIARVDRRGTVTLENEQGLVRRVGEHHSGTRCLAFAVDALVVGGGRRGSSASVVTYALTRNS